MKNTVKVIFGKEQVLKVYNSIPLNNDERQINVKEFEFKTVEEKLAFIMGLNEAVGWDEVCVPELELFDCKEPKRKAVT